MDKLAEKADLSVNYVGDLERGVKTPSLDAFIRIVEALDVPADVLIRDTAAPASYVADVCRSGRGWRCAGAVRRLSGRRCPDRSL